jgi:uncharacterized protein YoxC
MPGDESKEDYFMKVIKVQNHEGERERERNAAAQNEAKGSVTRTPPSLDKVNHGIEPVSVTVAGLDAVADQLAQLGDSLVSIALSLISFICHLLLG